MFHESAGSTCQVHWIAQHLGHLSGLGGIHSLQRRESYQLTGDGGYCMQVPLLEVSPPNYPVNASRTSGGMFPSTCYYFRPVPVSGDDTQEFHAVSIYGKHAIS